MENDKILLANNNSTIQKVIEITFQRWPITFSTVTDTKQLFEKLSVESFNLIILDNKITTPEALVEITSKIKTRVPSSKVLLMLNNSETFPRNLLTKAGIDDHILKPFESKDFINRCKKLLVSKSQFPSETIENAHNNIANQGNDMHDHQLHQELSEWTIPVPTIIGHDAETITPIPEVILSADDSVSEKKISSMDITDEFNIELLDDHHSNLNVEDEDDRPTNPTMSRPNWSNNQDNKQDNQNKKTSILDKLTPMDDLILDDNLGPDPELENNYPKNHPTPEKIDLSDEISSDDFWQETTKRSIPVSEPTESIQSLPPNQEHQQVYDLETIVNKLKEELTPLIENYVKQYCKETVEKVAWEIIPDLAENLIKKELTKLSESIEN